MKRLETANLVYGFILAGFMFSSNLAWAQYDHGTFRIGGQFGFGSDIESFGMGVRVDYALTSKFLLAPDFMYYFGDDDFGIEVNWYDINLNANYMIELNNPNIVPYVLGGFNIAKTSVSCEGALGSVCEDFSDVETGFNLGGGVDFILTGSLALFGELRAVIGGADQLVLGVGIKLPIN